MKVGKRTVLLFSSLTLVATALFSLPGCSKSTIPVTYIAVFRARPGELAGPPPSWTSLAPTNPFPSRVQGVLGPREKVFFGLIINKDAKEPVNFSAYTYFRQADGISSEFPLQTNELGPFDPGETPLIGIQDPWPVPTKPGTYHLRVYLGGKVVASAIFDVSAEDQ